MPALLCLPLVVVAFQKNWICTYGSNLNTYIGYGNTSLISGGVIKVDVTKFGIGYQGGYQGF